MSLAPEHKRARYGNGEKLIEKWVLRKAFDTPNEPYLPSGILWRQKEQFSDGVGYNWIDQMMAFCASKVTDQQVSDILVGTKLWRIARSFSMGLFTFCDNAWMGGAVKL